MVIICIYMGYITNFPLQTNATHVCRNYMTFYPHHFHPYFFVSFQNLIDVIVEEVDGSTRSRTGNNGDTGNADGNADGNTDRNADGNTDGNVDRNADGNADGNAGEWEEWSENGASSDDPRRYGGESDGESSDANGGSSGSQDSGSSGADSDGIDGDDGKSSSESFPEVEERVRDAEKPNDAVVGICIAIGLLILIVLVLILIFAVRRRRHLKR